MEVRLKQDILAEVRERVFTAQLLARTLTACFPVDELCHQCQSSVSVGATFTTHITVTRNVRSQSKLFGNRILVIHENEDLSLYDHWEVSAHFLTPVLLKHSLSSVL